MNKVFLLIILFTSIYTISIAQPLKDYKNITKANKAERREIIDIIKKDLKKEYGITCLLTINKLKVKGNYAFLMGEIPETEFNKINKDKDEFYDCCHIEGFFEKVKGKWNLVEAGYFSTDAWYVGYLKTHPEFEK